LTSRFSQPLLPDLVYTEMKHSFSSRMTLAVAAFIALPIALFAQQASSATATESGKQPATTISVDSRLVNIPVVVRDGKGALVQNLTKADFSLQVDGKPQTIRYFDLDRDLPLTLGLLVDTSQSVRNVLDEERTASTAFLDQMLTGKQDQAFVIQFARSVELLQDVTGSKPKLQAALKELDTPAPGGGGSSGNGGNDPDDSSGSNSGRRARGGGTMLYDAVFLGADDVMSKQKGRKALVVLTDGDDRGSKERLTDAIEKAQRADTIVYAIYFKGEEPRQERGGDRGGGGGRRGGIGFPGGGGYPGGGGGYPGGGGGYPGGGGGGRRGGGGGQPEQRPDGKKVLQRMTSETGGRMFEVSKKQTVADIYTEIGKELRSQYRLGYTPDKDAAEEGYHKIDLAFTSKDKSKFTIQTRDGYYTGK
jgi:VWFA-related protein